ncbi:protease inhibitor [Nonomuraea phyllanthi]|uniref:SSI family serine proteinase inhibitor n=1 Tax=Nonomuraea phyllanthi TaxID=2219224 RepID=UPI001293EA98|nr:SSI family serine proteinase inhibitor [Nonomuraea phyllanthi]QFY12943.1 protease inhibitor [Nonomuraea phyllanthi]
MHLSLPAVCVAAAASLVLASVPAQAAEIPNGLFLSVTGDGGATLRAVAIQCPHRAEQHPYGTLTCALLAAVDGNIDRLPGDPHPCTMEHDPVTATATGIWRNRRVNWQKTFSNACVLDAATSPVFRF